MIEHRIGIIMNGVTGRMGTNQHLLRSIAEIIKQGGVKIGTSETIIPDPVLVGRDENKLKKLCEITGIKKMSTSLDDVLKDPFNIIYFDAQNRTKGRGSEESSEGREAYLLRKACRGKH